MKYFSPRATESLLGPCQMSMVENIAKIANSYLSLRETYHHELEIMKLMTS